MARGTEQQSWLGLGWASARGFILALSLLAAVGLAAVFAFYAGERYVSENPRFRFRIARMAGDEDNLRVMGANRAAADQIRAFFRADQGRSLYSLPIEERRSQIVRVKWVREAAVIRRWPDGIDVVVSERRPVAFVHLVRRRSDPPKFMLVDAAGELLPIPDRHNYKLPVLLGLREDHTNSERAERLRLMRYFFDSIAGLRVGVAELDLTDVRNLRCRVSINGRSLMLLLGADGFGDNVKRFLNHWPEIQQRMPAAQVLDLRVADHITAAEAEPEGSER
jgi:cell division septal protein FtsQ